MGWFQWCRWRFQNLVLKALYEEHISGWRRFNIQQTLTAQGHECPGNGKSAHAQFLCVQDFTRLLPYYQPFSLALLMASILKIKSQLCLRAWQQPSVADFENRIHVVDSVDCGQQNGSRDVCEASEVSEMVSWGVPSNIQNKFNCQPTSMDNPSPVQVMSSQTAVETAAQNHSATRGI